MFSSRFNAGEKVVGEYGKGASLGAIEVLCDAPRPAKVVAIRDTELVKLSTSVFQFIIKKYPNVVVRFSRLVGRALLERSSTSRDEQGTPTNLTTVAVLGIGPDAPLSTFSKRLAAELMHIESTLLVDKVGLFRLSLSLLRVWKVGCTHSLTCKWIQTITSRFDTARGGYSGDVSLIRWLAEMEEKYQIVLYQCDASFTKWTRRCIRQADCILVIAWSHGDPALRYGCLIYWLASCKGGSD